MNSYIYILYGQSSLRFVCIDDNMKILVQSVMLVSFIASVSHMYIFLDQQHSPRLSDVRLCLSDG